jgi:hypothetical protein
MALWSNWTWGQKNHMGGHFLSKFSVKKAEISYNAINVIIRQNTKFAF